MDSVLTTTSIVPACACLIFLALFVYYAMHRHNKREYALMVGEAMGLLDEAREKVGSNATGIRLRAGVKAGQIRMLCERHGLKLKDLGITPDHLDRLSQKSMRRAPAVELGGPALSISCCIPTEEIELGYGGSMQDVLIPVAEATFADDDVKAELEDAETLGPAPTSLTRIIPAVGEVKTTPADRARRAATLKEVSRTMDTEDVTDDDIDQGVDELLAFAN